jgi:hypothetical protein
LAARYSGGTRPQPSAASFRIIFHITRPDRWTRADVRRDVNDALQRELARGGLSREDEALVLDCLVTDGLITGDAQLRSRIDGWSLRALELAPDVATLIGSRGAVLVELGCHESGKALLETVAFDGRAGGFDTLMSHLFLARAEHALGNLATARRLVGTARAAVVPVPPGLGALLMRTEGALGLAGVDPGQSAVQTPAQ